MSTPTQETFESQSAAGSAGYAGPAWASLPLTDVRSGQTFRLADFAGRTVYVEPMATWCPPCRTALDNLRQARAQVNDENIVYVALSVELDLPRERLSEYADGGGYDWLFAVATPELLSGMVETLGFAVNSPPATPHFIIHTDGSLTELVTGIHSPESLAAEIQLASGSGA